MEVSVIYDEVQRDGGLSVNKVGDEFEMWCSYKFRNDGEDEDMLGK